MVIEQVMHRDPCCQQTFVNPDLVPQAQVSEPEVGQVFRFVGTAEAPVGKQLIQAQVPALKVQLCLQRGFVPGRKDQLFPDRLPVAPEFLQVGGQGMIVAAIESPAPVRR